MGKCLYCYDLTTEDGDFHQSCSRTFFGTINPPVVNYTLDQMDQLAHQVIQRSISVPGVQPKLSMSAIRDSINKKELRLTVVGALGGEFIFKPPSSRFFEMPENEHLTMRMAEAFGLNVVPSTLIRLASGELAYLTRRIDRTPSGEKIHMLDFFQITEAFDKYKGSLERVGKALLKYSVAPLLDAIFLFELVVFCFLTGNNDMHLKNFSMIKGKSGWKLAPAYDLLNVNLVLPDDHEELALSLSEKKSKLQKIHFIQFGLELGLTANQIDGVFNRMMKGLEIGKKLISTSYLSDEQKNRFLLILQKKYQQIGFFEDEKKGENENKV